MRTNGTAAEGRWSAALAEAVRKRRKGLRLSQGELAQLAGCGTAFLYGLENGKASLRLDKVVDVLTVLGLRLTVEPGEGGLVAAERVA